VLRHNETCQLEDDDIAEIAVYTIQKILRYPARLGKMVENYSELGDELPTERKESHV